MKCWGFLGGLFLSDFGLSWLTSLQFIQHHVAGFYKPTIPQSPPSDLQDMFSLRCGMMVLIGKRIWLKNVKINTKMANYFAIKITA
jgi:hypothetical protein